jgi:Cu-Zn family superoxide dismutase
VGDLGNFVADVNGKVKITVTDRLVCLYGVNNVENRVVVIHELQDDLGLTDNSLSNTTGNAGSRIACGLIQYDYLKRSNAMKLSGQFISIFTGLFAMGNF